MFVKNAFPPFILILKVEDIGNQKENILDRIKKENIKIKKSSSKPKNLEVYNTKQHSITFF